MAFFLIPILLFLASLKLLYSVIWVPWRIQQIFRKQGVNGPNYRPYFGNTVDMVRMTNEALSTTIALQHDIVHRVLPDYYQWSVKYGKTFLCWFGVRPRLVLVDPDMIKEVLLPRKMDFIDRDSFNPVTRLINGDGLPGLMGHKWAVHRKIATPAFTTEKVKTWVPDIASSVAKMLDNWEEKIGKRDEFEMDVHEEFSNLAAEISSRTAFGSDFEKGKRIFELQQQQKFPSYIAFQNVYFPGFRYLPTKLNKLRWKLEKEMRDSMMMIIEACKKTMDSSNKIVSFLVSGINKNKPGGGLDIEEIINECRTMFFGWEATANTLTWAILLLAQHPDWQNKAREEVLQVCKDNKHPNAENLPELKIVNMIIQETLRLYPPDNIVTRQTLKDVKIGGLNIPAGTELYIPQTVVHHDTEIWGSDANEFNPARFVEPPKHLAAYFPFGLGSRICIAKNLATVEAVIMLAMIIKQHFFEISPSYVHAPMMFAMIQPQYGAPVLVRRISD